MANANNTPEISPVNEYWNAVTILTLDKKSGTIVDVDDFEKIGIITIIANGYATTKSKKLHRVITNAPKGMVVDHINRNRRDNRKANLRICHQRDNNKNRSPNKSDIRKIGNHIREFPIQTQLPDDDFDAFVDYCAHVRRSQAWVAREAIREYLTKQANEAKV